MQVTGSNLFWMQSLAQNMMRQKANARVNPLLEQVATAIGQQNGNQESKAVSKEMEAKLFKLEDDAKFDPNTKLVGTIKEKLLVLEQTLYGALGHEADRLNGLNKEQDFYNSVLDGTVDKSTAMTMHRHFSFKDPDQTEQFAFMGFESYLDANGYERKVIDPFDPDFTYKGSSAVYVASERYGYNIIEEDKVPYFEKWKEEKQAFQLEALKQYAAEYAPKIQAKIEEVPYRIAMIYGEYSIAKKELLGQLPEDFDVDEYEGAKIGEIFGEVGSAGRTDGKKMLELLKQVLSKQQTLIKDMGGEANNVNYFTNITPDYSNLKLDRLNMKV